MNMPSTDMDNPPIVPAARGNQNASLSAPNKNGMKPRIVEMTVKNIGVIFAFHAFK